MNKLKKTFLTALTVLMVATAAGVRAAEANYQVIPLPASIVPTNGAGFSLNANTQIVYPRGNEKMRKNAELLATYLQDITGVALTTGTSGGGSNAIVLKLMRAENKERYQIHVSNKNITISGASEAGVFYGIQTLRKATPIGQAAVVYPAVKITDQPRFGYRGMHLDVARYFQPVDFIKKYIDILALHNVNTFHWHLTDDQGWRIEIKQYPGLTEVGSRRSETVIGRNTGQFDGTPRDGFYTQEQIREVVRYAAERHITVIPEIDLPGHMLAALATYPELGCTGGPYEVGKIWGVYDDVLCVGQESTFTFLENVLTEVMALFPAHYIHIGGDECPKVRWEQCPRCQAKISELGLKDDAKHKKEFYLQSYVTERIEKFLNDHGRQIIGWDEILEGKLAPNATVMSWRGMDGGIEAARMGHDVIMTPSSHLYFDHYQTADTREEPLAIGGYAPVASVYEFEPVPAQLTAAQAKHILGVQANIWAEYIKEPDHVEYMLLPRLAALSEVQWLQPERKNYLNFLRRIPQLIAFYDKYGYTYATHIFDVQATIAPNPETETLDVEFATMDNAPVYYTLDGTTPTAASTRYTGKLHLKENAEIRAITIRPNGKASKVYREAFHRSKSTLKPITLLTQPAGSYAYNGAPLLNDGLRAIDDNFKSGRWMGFQENDLQAVIDLQETTEISKVAIQTCVNTGDWILDAESFRVEVSTDGVNYQFVGGIETDSNAQQTHWKAVMNHTLVVPALTARYVKVTVKPFGELPKWHGSTGKAFVFVDEIAID